MLPFVIVTVSCNSASTGNSAQKIPTQAITPPQTPTMKMNEPVDLKVIALPTADGGQEDSFVKDFKYPVSYTVNYADTFADKIAAFGAAYQVWVGPKGWTGRGDVGADGSLVVTLYTPGDTLHAGPVISYSEIDACQGCIASAAAPYFPEALKWYNRDFNEDNTNPVKVPAGLKINKVSPTLVTYTVRAKKGLQTKGVVYFVSPVGNDAYFSSAEFTLPEGSTALADFLMNVYITGRKLN
jgi:Domain of unknown function (DUF4850)